MSWETILNDLFRDLSLSIEGMIRFLAVYLLNFLPNFIGAILMQLLRKVYRSKSNSDIEYNANISIWMRMAISSIFSTLAIVLIRYAAIPDKQVASGMLFAFDILFGVLSDLIAAIFADYSRLAKACDSISKTSAFSKLVEIGANARDADLQASTSTDESGSTSETTAETDSSSK